LPQGADCQQTLLYTALLRLVPQTAGLPALPAALVRRALPRCTGQICAKTIGSNAFNNCTTLTTVTIPASVTKITFTNNSAFTGATSVNAASKTALQKVGYTGAF
jgi:hypothetical protein